MHYQSEQADSLESYFIKKYSPSLSPIAHHLYLSMRCHERQLSGLCKKVFVGYRELAQNARIDIKSVKKALQELQLQGLMEVTFGSPIKTKKQATAIRRKNLDEIKAYSLSTLPDDDCKRLAIALSNKQFVFENKTITPNWNVGCTGRVCSSKPNVQGMNGKERISGLITGLKQDQVLVHADIKQAEPTLIKHLLNISLDRDLYQEFMQATGCDKPTAKKQINILAYCRNSLACFEHWPEPAKAALSDYVQKLTDYKKGLFNEARQTRSTTTLSGRRINAEKHKRLHPGMIMNWRIQGTVADIINGACMRLLKTINIVIPMHDAIYAILPADKAQMVEDTLEQVALEMGLKIKIQTNQHKPQQKTNHDNKLGGIGYPFPPQLKGVRSNVCCTRFHHSLTEHLTKGKQHEASIH